MIFRAKNCKSLYFSILGSKNLDFTSEKWIRNISVALNLSRDPNKVVFELV